jgi:LPS-assembly lipoprotein
LFPDRFARSPFRPFMVGMAALALAGLVAGCTVRPMYDTPKADAALGGDAAQSMSMQSTLSSVSIKPASTRQGMEVRNRLIFLFGQGAGEPSNPAYTMTLDVSSAASGVAVIPDRDFVAEGLPSAGRVDMTGKFTIADQSGAVIGQGTRSATANYDIPTQGFAARSAVIDAEDRAARELAEMIHLATAQVFATRQ